MLSAYNLHTVAGDFQISTCKRKNSFPKKLNSSIAIPWKRHSSEDPRLNYTPQQQHPRGGFFQGRDNEIAPDIPDIPEFKTIRHGRFQLDKKEKSFHRKKGKHWNTLHKEAGEPVILEVFQNLIGQNPE